MEILLIILSTCSTALLVYFLVINRRPQSATQQELMTLLQAAQQQNLQIILEQLNQHRQSNETMNGQMTSRVFALQSKLSAIEEGNKRILDMSQGITELQNILQAPKLRGERGEMWLEELLAQMIPREHFKMQYRFKSGEICDAVILLRDRLLLPIDSKFSLENFKKMMSSEDPTEQKTHEKLFSSDVKKRVDEIARKYILPAEGTLGFAFMYIPAENVYYQAFIEDKGNHNLSRYAYEHHVIPVSPNSLYPYLEIVMFGLRGMEIEKSARAIQQSLSGLTHDLSRFEEEYRKVGTHLRQAQGSFDTSDKRLLTVQSKIVNLSTTELVEELPPEI